MQIRHMLACASLCVASSFGQAAVLFDVSFSSPPNINNQPIVIDGSNLTPSRQSAGSVQMVGNYAGQPGNWGVFNQPSCGSSYDQIEFLLPAGQQKVYLSYDQISTGLNNSDSVFSVHLDSADYGARSLSFHGGGNDISLFNVGGQYHKFGSFIDAQPYRVTLLADVAKNLLVIEIDGNQVHSGTLGSNSLTSIRMGISPWTGAAQECSQSAVGVSNIKVYEDPADLSVPPPQPTLGLDFTLRPKTTDVLPPEGGYIRHSRSLHNLGVDELTLSYWITTELADGTSYPLLSPRSVQVAAGTSFSELKSFLVPSWFPAGTYQARLVMVNAVTGERLHADLGFSKLTE